MSYTPQTWTDNDPTTPLSGARLTHMESGIAGADAAAAAAAAAVTAEAAARNTAITTAVNNLLNGAPGALDTLKELADAINDDASFAATVTTALAGKAPVATTTIDLVDRTNNTTETVPAGTTTNCATAGVTKTAPALAGTVGTPPLRFAVKNISTGSITVAYPDQAGSAQSLTMLTGETRTFRQKSTSGWGVESGALALSTLDGRFAPITGSAAYAPRETGLKHWKAVRSLAATRNVNITCIGDSITEGQGVATKANRWQDLLVASLRTSYPSAATGGEGFVSAFYAVSSFAQRWTFTGTTLTVGGQYGPGLRVAKMSAAATATLTFTGTSLDILLERYSASLTFHYTIDGGASIAVTGTTSTGGAQDGFKVPITGLSAGSHTIVITADAGGGFLWLEGAFIYNGDETVGVRGPFDCGHFNYTALAMDIPQATAPSPMDVIGLAQPDLITIMFGTNDWGSSSTDNRQTPWQMIAHIRNLIIEAKKRCLVEPSVCIMIPYKRGNVTTANPIPWTAYTAAITAVAAAEGWDLFDLGPVIGDLSVSNAAGLGDVDLIHPSTTGHAAIATALAAHLTA